MATVKIIKNQANEATFNSIFTLYENEKKNSQSNPFYENISDDSSVSVKIDGIDKENKSITFRVSGRGIKDNLRTYILSDNVSEEGKGLKFSEEGATWFENLREGKTLPSPDSDWAGMRDRIAQAYHRKYYTVEYKVGEKGERQRGEKICNAVANALGAFYSQEITGKMSEGYLTARLDASDAADTYYTAKLKVDVTLGVGQAMPLICRIYYKFSGEENERPRILDRSQARTMRDGMNTRVIVEETSEDSPEPGEDIKKTESILATIKNALDEDLNGPEGSNIFTRCALFSDESLKTISEHKDKATVEVVGDSVVKNKIYLECKGIKLISVAKLVWPNIGCDVWKEGKRVLKVNYNINGVTVRCVNCKGQNGTLIENDRLCYPHGNKKDGLYSIFTTDKNGLNVYEENAVAKRLADMKKSGVLEGSNLLQHLCVSPSCDRAKNIGGACGRLVCGGAYVIESGEKQRLCSNCPYPEIVYRDPVDGGVTSTKELFFDMDKRSLSKRIKGKNQVCSLCGEMYEKLSGGLCEACSKAVKWDKGGDKEGDDYKEGKALYKTYNCVLPTFARAKGFFAGGVCYENEGLLIFKVGRKMYKFNKLAIPDAGYMKPAKAIRDNG